MLEALNLCIRGEKQHCEIDGTVSNIAQNFLFSPVFHSQHQLGTNLPGYMNTEKKLKTEQNCFGNGQVRKIFIYNLGKNRETPNVSSLMPYLISPSFLGCGTESKTKPLQIKPNQSKIIFITQDSYKNNFMVTVVNFEFLNISNLKTLNSHSQIIKTPNTYLSC